MKENSFIGRVYEAKCGCKFAVKDIFVRVDEIKLKESNMMVEMQVVNFCDKDHKREFTPETFIIDLSRFASQISEEFSYSGPDWKLNTAETMKHRANYLKSLQKEPLDIEEEM